MSNVNVCARINSEEFSRVRRRLCVNLITVREVNSRPVAAPRWFWCRDVPPLRVFPARPRGRDGAGWGQPSPWNIFLKCIRSNLINSWELVPICGAVYYTFFFYAYWNFWNASTLAVPSTCQTMPPCSGPLSTPTSTLIYFSVSPSLRKNTSHTTVTSYS